MHRFTGLFFLLIIISLKLHATERPSIATDTARTGNIELVQDDPIVAALDSLLALKFFCDKPAQSYLQDQEQEETALPVFNDEICRERLARLNANSPIELVYNRDVLKYIELYAVKRRKLTSHVLGLANVYFPIFEEHLDRLEMPLELKYLAVIESALNPVARSRAGAMGLWQFMPRTGKLYGLKAGYYVDDRCDIYKATVAACEHLKDLYNLYGDYMLAIAAYNSGAGNVNRAIRRSGGKTNFWQIKKYLPRETRGYVPAFIAVAFVMNYAKEYNLCPTKPLFLYDGIDSVTVKQWLTFDQVSEMLGIPGEDIEFLNPAYRKRIIPADNGITYTLRLPKKYIGDFINNEPALYEFKTTAQLLAEALQNEELKKELQDSAQSATIDPAVVQTTEPKAHIVQSGEYLGKIAIKYGCSAQDIRSWNGLKNNVIYPKQKLYVSDPTSPVKNRQTNTTAHQTHENYKPSGKVIYYVVQKGDTLWDIANRYNGVSVNDIMRLNNLNKRAILQPGQKIKVEI